MLKETLLGSKAPPGFIIGDDGPFVPTEVAADEQRAMDFADEQRLPEGRRRGSGRFSVALSGGGIRAAAFQAGVLWRLASEGVLQDVEYLAAVSGGGYIASAFAAECVASVSVPAASSRARSRASSRCSSPTRRSVGESAPATPPRPRGSPPPPPPRPSPSPSPLPAGSPASTPAAVAAGAEAGMGTGMGGQTAGAGAAAGAVIGTSGAEGGRERERAANGVAEGGGGVAVETTFDWESEKVGNIEDLGPTFGFEEMDDEARTRQWYLDVLAKTICRMQMNAGDFVRDCVAAPCEVGRGRAVPRICDIPLLLVTLFVALSWNPFMLVISVVLPMTNAIEAFFGAGMRAAYCGYSLSESWFQIFQAWSPITSVGKIGLYSIFLTFSIFVARKTLPSLQFAKDEAGAPRATRMYLYGYNAQAFLARFTITIFVAGIFLCSVPYFHLSVMSSSGAGEELQASYCRLYIHDHDDFSCTDERNGYVWYESPQFEPLRASRTQSRESLAKKTVMLRREISGWGVIDLFFWGSLVSMVAATCLLPVIGSALLTDLLCLVGPLFVLVLLWVFVRFRVFGALTWESLEGGMIYDPSTWERFSRYALLLAFFFMPFYEDFRAFLHFYYRRRLKGNFFYRARDVCFPELLKCPYCPFVILTGTSSDFRPPHDLGNICELSFSPLHCGSLETGYIHTRSYSSLAKCAALSGAGSLDAIALSMSKALSLRFWLQVLNLSWGDYIVFEGEEREYIEQCSVLVRRCLGPRVESRMVRLMKRVPSVIMGWMYMGLLNWGCYLLSSPDIVSCERGKLILFSACWLVIIALGLSFFSFEHIFEFLAFSPVLRQVHQATRHCAVGDVHAGFGPPRLLYVTDGGVKDCTAVVQLMQRRCSKILLVLAASDPHDDLGVLRSTMQVATSRKLGSFYDPEDPRRDIEILLDRFKCDKEMTFLHIGIVYGWDVLGTGKSPHGDLFVVKMRLPPSKRGQEVQPPLEEAEIRSGQPWRRCRGGRWEGMKREDLGPFGCCDCCHTQGLNCGPKFPHGTFTGYLYLTPQWFTSLCRLGFEASEPVIAKLKESSVYD